MARDDGAVDAYAMAFSAAFEAKAACPGTAPDESSLTKLEGATGLRDNAEDTAVLLEQFSKWKKEFQTGILDKGAATWCSGILTLFGPGSTIPVIRTTESRP